jgi:DNA-binding transcriptional ArsR family regulator
MKQIDLAPIWTALADAKRRRIIQLLHEKSRTTSEICVYFDVSRFAIMQHLKVLEKAGLIRTRREGRQRWNSLNEDLFQAIQQAYLGDKSSGDLELGAVLSFLSREEGERLRPAPDSGPRLIELEVELPAPPVRVFRALTEEIDGWWSYRIMADSHMQLEPRVGGRFVERFKNGGGALYAIVTYLIPDEEIRLNGSMGLSHEGANHLIQITLHPLAAESTLLAFAHRFVGQIDSLTIDTFKRSWVELLTQQLRAFVQSGVHN